MLARHAARLQRRERGQRPVGRRHRARPVRAAAREAADGLHVVSGVGAERVDGNDDDGGALVVGLGAPDATKRPRELADEHSQRNDLRLQGAHGVQVTTREHDERAHHHTGGR